MSATINSGKLKFSVFGNGFESTRNDSGDGAETYEKPLYNYAGGTACIDSTNSYIWLTQNSGATPLAYLTKTRISDLELIEITNIPTDKNTYLYHPSNVVNNYGIAIQNLDYNYEAYVFDLTTNEIYYHFAISSSAISLTSSADCIMVNDDFYFVDRGVGSPKIYKLDVSNETFSQIGSQQFSNGTICGFVDNNTLYGFSNAVWFSDYARKYGFDLSGDIQWEVMNTDAGVDFARCPDRGMCGNGYVWLASYVNGAWHWGAYDGNNGGDFFTPSPIKMVGNFGNTDPRYSDYHFYYTDGRNKCAYGSSALGMVLVDFNADVKIITHEYWKPLAISNRYIVAIDSTANNTRIFRYR